MSQLMREKALFRYTSALERGDMAIVAFILEQAEQNPELEKMILEVNEIYQAEYEQAVAADDHAVIQQMIQEHLPSSQLEVDEDPPPLTVGDVVGRLQSDAAVSGALKEEVHRTASQVARRNVPLPNQLDRRTIAQLFQELGVTVSQPFQRLFHNAAVFLSMGREQNMARLAATRRQRSGVQPTEEKEEDE
jgi:hypothetical protein